MVPKVTKYSMSQAMAKGGVIGNDPNDPKNKNASNRKLPKELAVKYQEQLKGAGINPAAPVEDTDPIFYNRDQFQNFYRQKGLTYQQTADPDYAQSSSRYTNSDDYLISRGGVPDFAAYQKIVRDYERANITNPTDWSKLSSGAGSYAPASGYRYNRGLPDVESITKKPRMASGGKLKGPSHKYGGISAVDRDGTQVAEVEGGERIFSRNDTKFIDSLVHSLNNIPSTVKAQKLGKAIQGMVNTQNKNEINDMFNGGN